MQTTYLLLLLPPLLALLAGWLGLQVANRDAAKIDAMIDAARQGRQRRRAEPAE